MEHQSVTEPESRLDTFIYLVFGLEEFTRSQTAQIPSSIRYALNDLSFEMNENFPRTFHSFIQFCHQPLIDWYPLPFPAEFDPRFPLLDNGTLSDEAQDYCFYQAEKMQLSSNTLSNISQTMLDNLAFIQLRQKLKNHPDQETAQALYVRVRSFLIEHSWASINQLRSNPDILSELGKFYESIDSHHDFIECERCGLLENIHDKWVGLKPNYCSDHGAGSPYLQVVKNTGKLFRLKRGIHLRIFIPGRIELALFDLADHLQEEYPSQLTLIKRYPRLDSYDLQLTFSDEEVWAIDAKDQAKADRLGKQIKFPYGEGDLAYHQVFYVLPDRRMNDWGYRDMIQQIAQHNPANLHIMSLSEFQETLEAKLEKIAKSSRRKRD